MATKADLMGAEARMEEKIENLETRMLVRIERSETTLLRKFRK
jgi:hypothetical protein